jgi:hypothetical protein
MRTGGRPHRRLTWIGSLLFVLAFVGLGGPGLDYVGATRLLPATMRDHLSNYVITGVLCLSAGVLLASVSAPLWWQLLVPAAAVVVNFVVEVFVTDDNTPDLADFGAGAVGAVVACLAGLLIARFGTRVTS